MAINHSRAQNGLVRQIRDKRRPFHIKHNRARLPACGVGQLQIIILIQSVHISVQRGDCQVPARVLNRRRRREASVHYLLRVRDMSGNCADHDGGAFQIFKFNHSFTHSLTLAPPPASPPTPLQPHPARMAASSAQLPGSSSYIVQATALPRSRAVVWSFSIEIQ